MPVRVSRERSAAGKTYCHAHSRSACGYLRASACVFRGKFLTQLQRLVHKRSLRLVVADADIAATLRSLLHELRAKSWVVYAKQPFAGPTQVLDYLGPYTHRVAIANHRLLRLTDRDVRFRYKDYAHGNRRKVMTLAAGELIRRFLLHVLPRGFMRIRHYGILANRSKRAQLAQARAALGCALPSPPPACRSRCQRSGCASLSATSHSAPHCYVGHLHIVGQLARTRPPAQAPPRTT
jgi:hypothetical protein